MVWRWETARRERFGLVPPQAVLILKITVKYLRGHRHDEQRILFKRRGRAKPDADLLRLLVNVAHQRDLHAFFRPVLLVDTDGVDPNEFLVPLALQLMKQRCEILCDAESALSFSRIDSA